MDPQTQPTPVFQPPVNPQPLQSPQTQQVPTVPSEWPGAFKLYKHSKQAVKPNWKPIILLFVITYAISFGLQSTLKNTGSLIGFLIGSVIQVALLFAFRDAILGKAVSIGTAFKEVTPLVVLKYIVSTIFLGIALGFSALLLLIPFFFVFPRLVLSPYFLVYENLGPFKAINRSWEATKGHAGKVWGVFGAGLAMALLMITIIGIPFAIYFLFMYSAAFSILYFYITGVPGGVAHTSLGSQSGPIVGAATPQGPVPPQAAATVEVPQVVQPTTVNPNPQPTVAPQKPIQ